METTTTTMSWILALTSSPSIVNIISKIKMDGIHPFFIYNG